MTLPIAQQPIAQQPNPQAGGANAVAINIYNPQAYGGQPTNTQAPYAIPNSIYQMPNALIYPQGGAQQAYPQQYMPNYMPQGIVQQYTPGVPQQTVVPAPNMMPESVMSGQEINPAETANQTQQTDGTQQTTNTNNESDAPVIDVDQLVQDLKNTDPNVRNTALNKIAEDAQNKPEIANQVITEPIMNALTDIIKEDTSSLEGPTEEQEKILEKDPATRTPEEQEKVSESKLSPRDAANRNKMYALYTLALIQKLQRDELNQYIETQKANGETPFEPLKLEDLIGYKEMTDVIKGEESPNIKEAALSALNHVVTTEDKATVEPLIADALKSNDANVKEMAETVQKTIAG